MSNPIVDALKNVHERPIIWDWYEEQKVMGIIFADTGEQAKVRLLERIKKSVPEQRRYKAGFTERKKLEAGLLKEPGRLTVWLRINGKKK